MYISQLVEEIYLIRASSKPLKIDNQKTVPYTYWKLEEKRWKPNFQLKNIHTNSPKSALS
jgi:hypothetical protein